MFSQQERALHCAERAVNYGYFGAVKRRMTVSSIPDNGKGALCPLSCIEIQQSDFSVWKLVSIN